MNTIQYKCNCCGAELTFDPTQQNFTCDYCGNRVSEAEMQRLYANMEEAAAQNSDQDAETVRDRTDEKAFEEDVRLYTCPNCGAQILAEEETSATFCYYCHTPVMLSGRLSGEYRPSYVIPFSISHEEAVAQFQKWCKKRWFLPNDFRSQKQLENISGIYVPFWLTNCNADAYVSGVATRVRSWREGEYQVIETQKFQVERSAIIPFHGIPVDGAKKIEDALMHAIEPFSYKQMKPFQMQYLSGFLAQKYDENYDDVFPRIQKRLEQGSTDFLRRDIRGYTTVELPVQTAQLQNIQHDYVLLPVWFLHYQYKEKAYDFAINGQTGKQAGTPPLSWLKAILFSFGTALLTFLVLWLIGGFML